MWPGVFVGKAWSGSLSMMGVLCPQTPNTVVVSHATEKLHITTCTEKLCGCTNDERHCLAVFKFQRLEIKIKEKILNSLDLVSNRSFQQHTKRQMAMSTLRACSLRQEPEKAVPDEERKLETTSFRVLLVGSIYLTLNYFD